jgi:intergrase/recombinase
MIGGNVNRIVHLRRSAVRNMVQAGVPQQVAMKISGHKTPSMFQRYNIIVEDDVREALAKTEQYRETAQQKVISIAQR